MKSPTAAGLSEERNTMENTNRKSYLTAGTLTLMIAGSVISLRGLPMMAKEGLSMLFYILFAVFLFLLPASLVSAELGSAYSDREGGVYTWVKSAFGPGWGFTAIWLQWIQNVIWYPTVLGFAAGSLAYLPGTPGLAANGIYCGVTVILVFWIATIFALRGTHTVGAVTKYGVLLGTIIPGTFIILLGLFWVFQGMPLAFLEPAGAKGAVMHIHPSSFFPHIKGLGSIAFLAGIILLFAGVEVQAVHVTEMRSPARQFPGAMLGASLIIIVLFLFGSLSVAAVIPASEISLTAGLMEAFKEFLDRFKLGFLVPLMGALTAFGAIGGVMSWITGPSKGVLSTAKEGVLPAFLARTNSKGAPCIILLIQSLIVTVLGSFYFFMENVSAAFFILSAMTVTLYLIMYMLMYLAALKLRFSAPDLVRPYRVPGGWTGITLVTATGLAGVIFAFVVAFFPPADLPVGDPALYVALVTAGTVIFTGLPWLIRRRNGHVSPTQTKGDINYGSAQDRSQMQ